MKGREAEARFYTNKIRLLSLSLSPPQTSDGDGWSLGRRVQ